MPTYALTDSCRLDYQKLGPDDRARFRAALRKFIDDADTPRFRPGLRVKGVTGARGVYEMTWAPDGRATFEFGRSRGAGPHIIWRRIGDHGVLDQP